MGCLGANHVNIGALAYLSINKKSSEYQNIFCQDKGMAAMKKSIIRNKQNLLPWGCTIDEIVTIKENNVGIKSKQEKATIIANRTQVVEPLSNVLSSAKLKLKARAYVHWYEKFGLEESELGEALNRVEDMMHNYQDVLD